MIQNIETGDDNWPSGGEQAAHESSLCGLHHVLLCFQE
jgi:hypothetical protein